MAFILQVLGILAIIGFLWFIWPPLTLLAAGASLFAVGWAFDKAPAPMPKDDE